MSSYVQLQCGQVRWLVRQEAVAWLFHARRFRLQEWLQAGQATVVKHGPHRTVFRVNLPERTVYVKHYRVTGPGTLLNQWARRSRGRREWRGAERAAGHQVPTIVPLALGEQRRAGLVWENFLVTEGIDAAEPLDRFVQQVLPRLPAGEQDQLRRRLPLQLADMLARLHQAGLVHRDLHAGNVLVRCQSPGRLELFLIDMHTVARVGGGRPLGWRRSRANLLAFGRFFLDAAGPIDRLRFIRRYLELRPDLGIDWRRSRRLLYDQLLASARRFWRRRDFRCVQYNRRFYYANSGRAHGFAVAELKAETFRALLDDPDQPLERPETRLLKDSGTSTVAIAELPVGGQSRPVIYKRFNCPKALDPVRATLHHSPALRAWHAGHGLLNRAVPTPRPLLVIERTGGPLVRQTYLATELIAGATQLDVYLRNHWPGLPPAQQRRQIRALARQLGRLMAKMHQRNISHRDLKAANMLLRPTPGSQTEPELMVIDLAGVQIWRRLPERRRRQNLARLAVSFASQPGVNRTDLLRCLLAYLAGSLRYTHEWKVWWREVQRQAERKIARNLSRRRLIS